jgi:hypothetical protein
MSYITLPRVTKCFIATAAYGSPMANDVIILREFRDRSLLTNSMGKVLVEFYYHISPPLAAFIKDHEILKNATRVSLTISTIL